MSILIAFSFILTCICSFAAGYLLAGARLSSRLVNSLYAIRYAASRLPSPDVETMLDLARGKPQK